MGKYAPLTRYLESLETDSWETHFGEIERILGFKLPDSAAEYPAWWANQKGGGHSQTRGWQDAGFETRNVNLLKKKVRFERMARSVVRDGEQTPYRAPDVDLWSRAREISGIENRDALIEAALQALIRQETLRYFEGIGGTMPAASPAPRERPFG